VFELFKVGFLSVTFLDLIDIFLVTFIVYKLYTVVRGTIAAQIFIGLIIVLFLSFLAQAVNLKALGFLLNFITDIWVIAFIILFQPEIRRLLVMLGSSPLGRIFVKGKQSDIADILTEAAFELAQNQHGALIVIIRSTGIKGIVEQGDPINAKLTKSLLRAIFFPRSPLHDGAVIVNGDIVEAARCTLPLSAITTYDGVELGMRHRAGLGITENADVISLIVSEETGGISIADRGELKRGMSKDSLRLYLTKNISIARDKGIKNLFDQFGRDK
jgi:diadenylate cyclase